MTRRNLKSPTHQLLMVQFIIILSLACLGFVAVSHAFIISQSRSSFVPCLPKCGQPSPPQRLQSALMLTRKTRLTSAKMVPNEFVNPLAAVTNERTSKRRTFLSLSSSHNAGNNDGDNNEIFTSNTTMMADLNGEHEAPTVEYLEQKLSNLTQALEDQKLDYQNQILKYKKQSDRDVQSAQDALERMRSRYLSYKMEMETKQLSSSRPLLDKNSNQTIEMKQKQQERDISELQERSRSLQEELQKAKIKLASNYEARKSLQAEMVALRHGYFERLSELEDALELEQNARVKDRQEATESLEKVQAQLKQRLRDTLEESKRNLEIMTKEYQQQLSQREEELQSVREKVQATQDLVQRREEQISSLQNERQSVRKLVSLAYQLIRKRVRKRLSIRRERRRQREQKELEQQRMLATPPPLEVIATTSTTESNSTATRTE